MAVNPAGVKAEGKCTVVYVPTLTDPTDVLVSEWAAGLDVSYFITAGNFQAGGEQAKGDDRRLGSKKTYQTLGRTTDTIGDIVYIADPQAAAAAPSNEAYETFKEGITGFFLVRWGIDVDTAGAAAQKIDVYPIEFGSQNKTPLGENDEFAKLTVTQAVAVTGPVQKDVPLATS